MVFSVEFHVIQDIANGVSIHNYEIDYVIKKVKTW